MLAIAVIALASGFGQFGAVAALGDVSKQLGHVVAGSSIADKVGLSGTSLGVGLAVIRLASLGSLPLIGSADRLGRRRVILAVTVVGLAFTIAAAASPGYWWFVVIFAFGRPLLSATNALAEVMAAEETSSKDRSTAIALIAAGYGVGAGLSASCTAWLRGPWASGASSLGAHPVGRRAADSAPCRRAEPFHDRQRRSRPPDTHPGRSRPALPRPGCRDRARWDSPSRSLQARPTASYSSTPRTSCTWPGTSSPSWWLVALSPGCSGCWLGAGWPITPAAVRPARSGWSPSH